MWDFSADGLDGVDVPRRYATIPHRRRSRVQGRCVLGRNGRPDGKCGSAWSARNVGGRHGQHTVLRSAQRLLRVIRFDAEVGVIYPQYTYGDSGERLFNILL
jgi:hypothetical protein